MDIQEAAIIIVIGIVAGFINIVSGGGSLLTLPLLISMGLPSSIANGTNRVAILFQNFSGTAGFKSKGVSAWPFSLWVGISATIGAIIGSMIAIHMDSSQFNFILGLVMFLILLQLIFSPFKAITDQAERTTNKSLILSVIIFFFIGIYGGFIQAGVGILMMLTTNRINHFSLVKSNSVKTLVNFMFTIAALITFIVEDQVRWDYGLTLALGSSFGAWIASRVSVNKGEVFVKRFLIGSVSILAIKMWFPDLFSQLQQTIVDYLSS